MSKKIGYFLFKIMALNMILSLILPTGLSVYQTKAFASTTAYLKPRKKE